MSEADWLKWSGSSVVGIMRPSPEPNYRTALMSMNQWARVGKRTCLGAYIEDCDLGLGYRTTICGAVSARGHLVDWPGDGAIGRDYV
jgi:hypothetical protein